MEHKVIGGSSRGQEDGRCQDTQSPHLYRKGDLMPEPITDLKQDICGIPYYGLKELVIFQQHKGEETRSPVIVKELRNGKGVSQKE